MREEFYKKTSRRPEGLLPSLPAIVQLMLMASSGRGRPTAEESSKPRLVSVVALDGLDESAVLAFGASLAAGLDTPLAAAILDSARERDILVRAVDRFHDSARNGVAGAVDGHSVVVGNAALFRDLGISLDSFGNWPDRLRQRGEQALFLAIDGRTAAFFGIANLAVEDTHSNDMEDRMQRSEGILNAFPTATTGLPAACATETFQMADGEQFNLRISPVAKRFGDRAVRMLAYNGSIPGPTLRVQQGSELLVNVANDGDLEATVHWHGLRLDNRYDGTMATQQPIPFGGTFTYRLTFPDPGVYWYHPHIREDYGQEMGLSGTIVVVPSEPNYWPAVNRELTLMLDDILLDDGGVAAFDASQPTFTAMGRFGNGEPEMSLRAKTGEVVRFYLTNAANTRVFNVAASGARMKPVGGDSGRYERETFVDSVVIAPSERMVVDVLFERPGEVALEHRTPHRTYRVGTINVDSERAEPWLATEFAELRTNSEIAAERTRHARFLVTEPDKTLALVAEMDMAEPQVSPGATLAYTCPMHPEVNSPEPGKCPQCGMKLLAAEPRSSQFVCPMHPEVTSSEADRCPKCGMKLVPANLVKEAAHGHDDHHTHGSPGEASEEATGNAPPLAGIEWEDDMVDLNRMTNPTNMRWKLVDRPSGAEGGSIDWRFRLGDQIKIRIVNEMDSDHPMHHPFHIHGAGRFLILSRDGVVEPNLVWKDTVLIPTGQTVDILLDVTHPGVWMAHCHIAEHHESGMFLSVRVDA
jgi:FtsP/CotA-like multicopper oxidase with cupredoxin domain